MSTEIKLCLKNNKKVCYSGFYVTDDKLNIQKQCKFNNYDFQKHLISNFINDCALIESQTLVTLLPFRSNLYHNHSYWDLWLRLYEQQGNVFIYNQQPAFYYRQHSNALHIETQNNNNQKHVNDSYRIKLLSQHINYSK